jgi:hypothetical protein
MKLTVGQLRERALSSDRRNRITYGLFTLDHDYSRIGRLRIFNMVKSVKDNIQDDRREPTPFLKTTSLANIEDILPARDTWVNSTYVQFDYRPVKGLNAINKLKYDLFEQRGQAFKQGDGPILNAHTHFLGIINKLDYTHRIADLIFQPRCKSEFLNQTPFLREGLDRKEWTGTWTLLMRHPLLRKTFIEGGTEFTLFKDLTLDEDKLLHNGPAQATGDFRNLVLAIQWTNVGEYLGYNLTTQFGFSFTKKWNEKITLGDKRLIRTNETEAFGTSFITVFAGAGR